MRPIQRLLLSSTVLALALLCEGCPTASSPGTAPPTALQTFDTLYANAVTADDVIIKTGTVALETGLINATQAKKVLAITDAVKTALDAAHGAAQLGNLGLANSNLAQALGPIATLSACLTMKPLTPSTFDSCVVRLTVPAVQS
jgi:hypothetical protein